MGDCIEMMKTLPSESVHTCVTSPPYWGLRDYGVGGQLGLETSPQEYVEKMVAVFRDVRRVLRGDGTCWINLGSSYSRAAGTNVPQTKKGGTSHYPEHAKEGSSGGFKPKDMVPIPWMVAMALQAEGWYLRCDIIWAKPNPMPESVEDRPTKAHEYLFLLAKSERYYYDHKAILEPLLSGPSGRYASLVQAADQSEDGTLTGRNKRSVWNVATAPYSGAHFATFPPALIEPCILAGCPERTCGACGTALDSRYGEVRTGTKGKNLAPVRMVREEGVSGPQESSAELLQQGLRVQMDREEPQHDQGLLHHVEGLHRDLPAGSPGCVKGRVRDGAQAGHAEDDRPAVTPHGDRASSRRQSKEQQAEELGNADEAGARQSAEAQDWDDSLPLLRREDTDFSVCPRCNAALNEVGIAPGVVLDCFGGAGTTGLVADRLQRNAILIELNPEYAAMARRRIVGDAPLFAEVAWNDNSKFRRAEQ